jgi:hypothetical protein
VVAADVSDGMGGGDGVCRRIAEGGSTVRRKGGREGGKEGGRKELWQWLLRTFQTGWEEMALVEELLKEDRR